MTTSTTDQLRTLIRELISEVLPHIAGALTGPRHVTVTNDKELNTFVRHIVELLDNPTTGPMVRDGQLTFTMTAAPTTSHATAPTPTQPAHSNDSTATIEIPKGVITERIVTRAIAEGKRIITGPRVVMTPLAREHIRRSGIRVDKRP